MLEEWAEKRKGRRNSFRPGAGGIKDGGRERVASLAESVELIDPLLCLPLAGIPRVPHETGHGDESAELGCDDADGRGVRAQVFFHRRGG